MAIVILFVVVVGGISMLIDSSYIDINEIIAASMMMPTVVLEWARSIDLVEYVNIMSPFAVVAGIILLVVKLRKPK
jgi:nitrate reductase gamma subunit